MKELDANIQPEPDRYVLGVAGAHISSFESRDTDYLKPNLTRQWHTLPISRLEYGQAVAVPAPFWPDSPVTQAEFRFQITAAHLAGFHSCYLTSPSMGRVNEEDGYDPNPKLHGAVEEFVYHHHDSARLGNQIALDGVVEMTVPGQEPEAAATSASAAEQPDSVVTTCNTREIGSLEVERETDRFEPYRQSRAHRACASVQRFQPRNVQASLNKHTYLSGILLSAGMVMLLDALMAATAAVATQAHDKAKKRGR